MERLISMILRRLVNKGINAGVRAASRRGETTGAQNPEARQMNKKGQQNKRGLRNATRLLRKVGKF